MHRLMIALGASLAWSVGAHAADASQEARSSASQVYATAEGEVRRVDREGGKLTIRHGPIRNLDMPPMTMVFQVVSPAMLDAVKPGDKVTFEAEKVGNAYRITRIVAAPTPK